MDDPDRVLALQIAEHKERLLAARLQQNMAKQYDLQTEEGELRCKMQKIENEKYTLLKAC